MEHRELDTKIYLDYAAANWTSADFDEVAAAAYWAAESKAKAEWDAIPECDAKDSAMINADDMMGEGLFSYENKLAWYVAAVASYDFA